MLADLPRALERDGFELTVAARRTRDGRVGAAGPRARRCATTRVLVERHARQQRDRHHPAGRGAGGGCARARGVLIHTDAVQALGKIPLDVEALGVDLALRLGAQGARAQGRRRALRARRASSSSRSSTAAARSTGCAPAPRTSPGIVGFGAACELAERRLAAGEPARLARLRDRLEAGRPGRSSRARGGTATRRARRHDARPDAPRHPRRVARPRRRPPRRPLLVRVGVPVRRSRPVARLLAMGLSAEEAHCSVRFSLGAGKTEEDVDQALARLDGGAAATPGLPSGSSGAGRDRPRCVRTAG